MGAREARVAALLRAATVEVYAKNAPQTLAGTFPKGVDVYVSYLPGDDPGKRVEIAQALRDAGYNPALHVPARQMLSEAFLDDFLGAAAARAQTTRALVIAGDSTRPRGPYATALDLIQSGAFGRHGFTRVDVAGHPEGNVGLSPAQLFGALRDKRAAAARAGLGFAIVTQFAFDPRPIEHWLGACRDEGIDAPVRIGLAGPANPATLLRFALRCGVGASIAAVQNHVGTIGRLLRDTGPDGVVRGLEDALASDVGRRVESFHFFPFGGLAKTGAWIAQAIRAADGAAAT